MAKRIGLKERMLKNKFKKIKRDITGKTKRNEIDPAQINHSKTELIKQLTEFEKEAGDIIEMIIVYKNNYNINIDKLKENSENGPVLADICSFIPAKFDSTIDTLTAMKNEISVFIENINTDTTFNMINVIESIEKMDNFRIKIMESYMEIQTITNGNSDISVSDTDINNKINTESSEDINKEIDVIESTHIETVDIVEPESMETIVETQDVIEPIEPIEQEPIDTNELINSSENNRVEEESDITSSSIIIEKTEDKK